MILFINSGGALLVVENMSKKIARYFIKQAIICGEDEETYSYGFEILLATIIAIFLTLFVGIIAGKILDTIIFLIVYCSLRQSAGGYHADTHMRCISTFVFMYILILFITNIVDVSEKENAVVFVLTLCNICMSKFAPIGNSEISYDDYNSKTMKSKVMALLVIYEIFILYCLYSNNSFEDYATIGVFAIVWESILLILGKIQNLCEEVK